MFQENTWTSDLNQFIQDDDNEAMNLSVRLASEEFLFMIADRFTSSVLGPLYVISMDRVRRGNELRAQGLHAWFVYGTHRQVEVS